MTVRLESLFFTAHPLLWNIAGEICGPRLHVSGLSQHHLFG